MSNVWFTSDLHIGHQRVADIRAEAMGFDPLVPAEEHDEYLANEWDSVVRRDDTVWVLGDISSGTKSGQLAALEWIRDRNGFKHLIIGNHDGVHPMHRDSHKWMGEYLTDGCDGRGPAFQAVQLHAKRRIGLGEGHVTALLSHFPYTGDHTDQDRHAQWRLPDCGDYVIHGHVHNGWKLTRGGEQIVYRGLTVPKVVPRINQIHVGVDAWDFAPVHVDQINSRVQRIEDGVVDPLLVWSM